MINEYTLQPKCSMLSEKYLDKSIEVNTYINHPILLLKVGNILGPDISRTTER